MKLSLAYSPCPNDTFMFHALATGAETIPGCVLDIHLHDVETLNREAFREAFDITKLSFHAWLLLQDRYCLLNAGAALGFGCGPLIVSAKTIDRDALPRCRVAVPGEHTTAHLLLRLYAPGVTDKVFTTYDRILPMVRSGEADCGVIIHESRFTYEQLGFHRIADLGAWWEGETGLPIPLGCIVARHSLPDALRALVEDRLRAAIEHSRKAPAAAMRYAAQYAQEMAPEVLRRHIEMYVNEFSLDLGAVGQAAVAELGRRARMVGMCT